MTCPGCTSIWMRPAEPAWLDEGSSAWTRRFHCGECGGVFIVRVTRIGSAPTDGDKNLHKSRTAPAPKSLAGENGETAA